MIRLAVIGAGSMGTNHARVAMGMRDATVSVVVDSDPARAALVADRTGARGATDYRSIMGAVDAAIVATPTPTHQQIVTDLLAAGVDILVEKPIADTADGAREMIDTARAFGRKLMVGHVERFNPAVLELRRILSSPIHIAAQRISPYTPHVRDGVAMDLMIHDLDLVASIADSPVSAVSALSRGVHTHDDLTVALLEFENGVSASLTASRLGQDKVREITITQRSDFVRADLIRQSLAIHRVGRVESSHGGGLHQTGVVEIPFLQHRGEPLLLQLGHFIDCLRADAPPAVPGEDGLRALELVHLVQHAAVRTPAGEDPHP